MQITPLRGSGTTILVVDDDALITLNTADIVTEIGYRALEAFSGAEALSLLERNNDIVAMVTDYSMPGMNGVELATAARKLRPGLPVLLTSGHAELPGTIDHDFVRLEKPYREDELTERLKSLLTAPTA
ncbi:Response regulator receiver domain-containing protein [Devosia lucknowensis]|uniref:Response regulator receiver domain-containing protein n=1 Tax=Devosia lucknowensis TaxID=1096929 RepID=A0A1Y6GCP5_9HYPH|nr:response regulator [Devosia lucknowensis]SMQ85560.1 Response regulator receiver domain-containing protein [Devosia lucknowensis]